MSATSILIAEDEGIVAHDLAGQLRALGYVVTGIAESGGEALRMAELQRPSLVLMDVRLKGGMDGIETAQVMRSRLHLPVVYLTAHADDSTLQRAMSTEPYGYLLKPFHERELRTVIEMAVYKHKAERDLQLSEQRFAETLAAITEGVITVCGRRGISFANPAAGRLLRRPAAELVGRPLQEVMPLQGEGGPLLTAETLGPFRGRLRRADGSEMEVEGRASPMANAMSGPGEDPTSVVVFRDVTEERRMAEQTGSLFDSIVDEHLLTIATLAGSMAEDLHVLLTSVSSNAELLQRRLPNAADRTLANQIVEAARQSAELTGQLLAHAGSGFLAAAPVQLTRLVQEAQAALSEPKGDNVALQWQLAEVPETAGDPQQLGRLLEGLVANARAGLGTRGGVIRVSVGTQTCDRRYLSTCVLEEDHAAGEYVFLEVADDGQGIPPDLLPRLFDPCFTGGSGHQGAGLAAALGIVRGHRGVLRIDTAPGRGTAIRVLLPKAGQAGRAGRSQQART